MDILALAIVLLLLFAASYSGRRFWAALGSITLSAILIAGSVLLLTAERAGPFIGQFSGWLPQGWERHAQNLAEGAARASQTLTPRQKQTPETTHASVSATPVTQWFDASRPKEEPLGARPDNTAERRATVRMATPSLPPAKAGEPVKWLVGASAPPGTTAVLAGANFSDAALEPIRATLRPDLRPDLGESGIGSKTIPLRITVEGHGPANEQHATTIPPGTKFYLSSPEYTAERAADFGGAIISFAYVQDGRRRTSIMYLKQEALAGALTDSLAGSTAP